MNFRILTTATPEMIDRVRIYTGAGDRGIEGDADTLVRALVRDVFTASAAQVLHDAGTPSFRAALPDVPLSTLLHDRLSHLVAALKMPAFHRFVFHSVMQREHDLAAGATRNAYATYLQPRFALISEDQSLQIRNALNDFLDRWVPTRAFWDQFSETPHLTDAGMLSDLNILAARVHPLLGEQLTLDLLGFWIPRQKEPPAGVTPLMATLRSAAARRSGFGGGGFIEFFLGFSSDLAISLLKASAAVFFRRDQLRIDVGPDDPAEWLNEQFYERAGPHLFNVRTHPKGKRLLTICAELLQLDEMADMADETLPRHPAMSSLSRAEIRQTHRYLTAHTRKHFLGSFAEFLGATLAIRATGGLGAQTLIPGHSIRIANGRRGSQGPDGILGTLRTDAAGATTLHVNALLEVKGYDPSPRAKPREQLLKHERRMAMHGVRLSFDPATNRWVGSASGKGEGLIIKNIVFDDDCRHIAILPSQSVDHSDGAYSEIYLPWTGDGLRRMAAFHLREVLAQAALVVDPEETIRDLGERAWYAALAPYENDPGFSNEDRAAIRDLIDTRKADTLLRSKSAEKP